jgi:flagellar biosynthesis protein FlhF
MRIKKFTGATLKAATDVMKEELGGDAIVLATRKTTKGGVLHFLGKEEYEVTGAIDEQPMKTSRAFANQLALAGGATPQKSENEDTTIGSLQKVAQQFEHRLKDKQALTGGNESLNAAADIHSLKNEVEGLKAIVNEVAIHLKYNKMPALPEHLKNAYTRLIEQDVDEKLAAEVTQKVYRALGEDVLGNKHRVDEAMITEIASLFPPLTKEPSKLKRKVVALVGPTGVGKTTTIAKLAAIHKLMYKQNVALITADTYRIGAIEQLKTFAAIADIPMEVVYAPSEMKRALVAYKGKDTVFIDTVGRSQRMKKDIVELSKFISAAQPDEVHLVLSASTGRRTLSEITENFSSIGPTRLIFSKTDEVGVYGQLANIAHQSRIPISHITTGQSVPDDIKVADNMQLAKMVFTGEAVHA